MSSGSTGRYDTSGCHSTTGETWRRFKTSPPNGCGLTTMTDPIWPWADLHQSSVWPWLRNVSTSETIAKGDDYQLVSPHVIQQLFANRNLYTMQEVLHGATARGNAASKPQSTLVPNVISAYSTLPALAFSGVSKTDLGIGPILFAISGSNADGSPSLSAVNVN